MTATTCLYCGGPLDGSVEHILLSGLGGRKTSTTVCCSTCNNTLGGTIDKSFTERLHVFMNLIDGKTGRNRDTATLTQLETTDGEKLNLQPGCKPVVPKGAVTESVDASGQKHIQIRAPKGKVAQIVRGKLEQHGVSLDSVQVHKAVSNNEYVSTHVEFTIGGLDDMRAVAKMLLSYLSVQQPDETRSGRLSEVIDLVQDGIDVPKGWLDFDFSTPFPNECKKAEFEHRMFVFARSEEGLAFGLLELFGEIRFSCILSDRWQGPSLGSVYRVDPVSGAHFESECNLPTHITKSKLLHRAATKQQLFNAIDRISAKAFKQIDDKVSAELAESALQKRLHRTDLTQSQKLSVISEEFAEGLVRQMYRLDRETEIDIKEVLDPEIT